MGRTGAPARGPAPVLRGPDPGPEPVRPVAYAVVEGNVHDAPLQQRGDPEKPGDVVPRRWLEILGGEPVAADGVTAVHRGPDAPFPALEPDLRLALSIALRILDADGRMHTKGDNNPYPDDWTIAPGDVVGLKRLRIPHVAAVHLRTLGRRRSVRPCRDRPTAGLRTGPPSKWPPSRPPQLSRCGR